ncbi:MAG: SagB/ThcOx family dehydrogenase [Mycobacteriales bacterium]
MRVRTSRCGLLYWEESRLIWDDYLAHRRFPLAAGVEGLLRSFGDWRAPETVIPSEVEDDGWAGRVVAELLAADVLVGEGTPRDRREREVLASWQAWGVPARAFHFSTRLHRDTAFQTLEQQDAAFDARLDVTPPPPAFAARPGSARTPLPSADLPPVTLQAALDGRRSHRTFGAEALPRSAVGTLLRMAAGPTGHLARLREPHGTVFKTSPSGGGRHPTELYPIVCNVAGIEPAVYHYDGLRHELERVGDAVDGATLTALCGDQEWAARAGMVVVYTSVMSRLRWKYGAARTYRVLLLDAGHLSQTVYLVATALGLGSTFTAAIRDELAEQLLGIDAAQEPVIGCAVIGSLAPAGAGSGASSLRKRADSSHRSV